MTIPSGFLCLLMALVSVPSESDEMCGTYALFVGLNALDAQLSGVEALGDTLGPPPRGGHSLADLAEAAEKHGFRTLGVETTLRNLSARPGRFACIAHMKHGHFVLISKIDAEGVHIIDPPNSSVVLENVWNAACDGDLLLISREELISESDVQALAERLSQAQRSNQRMWRWLITVAVTGILTVSAWVGLLHYQVSRTTA